MFTMLTSIIYSEIRLGINVEMKNLIKMANKFCYSYLLIFTEIGNYENIGTLSIFRFSKPGMSLA